MAVKHIEDYYNQISNQYKEMIQDIKDLELEAEQGLVEPERIARLQEQVAPIKQNYERWSYMMFLLHQPARKSKIPKYKRQNQKFIANFNKNNSIQAVIDENKEALKHVGE